MRVTHVITRLVIGGAQENTVASVLGLCRKPRLEVSLISGPTLGPEGSLEHRFANAPGILQIAPRLIRPIRPWSDWLAFRHLEDLFRAQQPDLVHTHSGKAGILGRLAAARAGVPMIVHTIHGPSFGPFQGAVRNLAFRTAERVVAKTTTAFVAVAEAMKTQYLAAGIGRADQYTRIFSGFDLEPFLSAANDLSLRAALGLNAGDFVIGKIARLTELKGHDELFRVAPSLVRSCPQIKFLLVGDGHWRERFERQVRGMGLREHFVFAGLVPPERVAPLVGIMDTLVHLSRREGLPRALPQALAAARPIVAYDCDGAGEVCLDGQTGFLVEPGDTARIEKCLLTLARDPALRQRLAERGQEFVRRRFSAQQMVDDLHALYLRLALKTGTPSQTARLGLESPAHN